MDGIRSCIFCGEEVGLRHKFCFSCGKALSSKACLKCGTTLKAQEEFCHECGFKVSDIKENRALEEGILPRYHLDHLKIPTVN